MSRKTSKGADVEWVLPGKKRAFATTTLAVSYLLTELAKDRTWREVLAAINYDPEAKAIAEKFVHAGYGDRLAYPFVVRRAKDPADQIVALSPSSLHLLLAGRRISGRPEPLAERTIHLTIRDLARLIGSEECSTPTSASTPATTTDAA